jgi:beta-lactamase superfamily II metal-dependent hydrolase
MRELRCTIIDVGWGDSILIESQTNDGKRFFGLIDSNDSVGLKSSFIHISRRFDLLGIDPDNRQQNFAFILLTHAHADHAEGLIGILRRFGTEQFWYPKSGHSVILGNLLRFANRSNRVGHHQAIDSSKRPRKFGEATLKVLWPPPNTIDTNENNNSVILAITLGKVVFLFGGDAEADVWEKVVERFPRNVHLFKVPHHGADNGTFGSTGQTPWLDKCPKRASLAISSHVRPFPHPDQNVVTEFKNRGFTTFRTDQHHHLTFETDGKKVKKKYSH